MCIQITHKYRKNYFLISIVWLVILVTAKPSCPQDTLLLKLKVLMDIGYKFILKSFIYN